MKSITNDEILSFDKNYRTQFVNSLAGLRQIALVGTKSNDGFENLAIFNSIIHLGANPPLLGLVSRPDTVERHTLGNIENLGYYTINFVESGVYAKAHQTSARYGKEESEFVAINESSEYLFDFKAPYLKNALVKIGLSLVEKVPIKANGTILIIGQIEVVHLPDSMLKEDGWVNYSDNKPLISCGLDAYFEANLIDRLSYAKKDTLPKSIL